MNANDNPVLIYSRHMTAPRLDLYYPVVYGMPNQDVQQHINKAIWHLVCSLLKEQGYYDNPQAEVTGRFEIKTNERGILSLSIINYTFSGGAHGLTIVKSLTFDVQTGRTFQLSDLFKPNSNYILTLSEIIKEQIAEREIVLLQEFTAIRPDQDYYIADKALVIYFQQYEIAAYVYGILYFPISVYEIQDIIDENGPLGRMLG